MSLSDMFLKIDGTRQGAIKGDAQAPNHIDEVVVVGWSWGMDTSAASFAESSGRTTMQHLVIRKRVDRATTALMSALRNNEPLKKVVLTACKVGGDAKSLDYFKITLEKARVMSHHVGSPSDNSPDMVEEVHFAFFKVNVQFTPQTGIGGGGGATIFETEITTP